MLGKFGSKAERSSKHLWKSEKCDSYLCQENERGQEKPMAMRLAKKTNFFKLLRVTQLVNDRVFELGEFCSRDIFLITHNTAYQHYCVCSEELPNQDTCEANCFYQNRNRYNHKAHFKKESLIYDSKIAIASKNCDLNSGTHIPNLRIFEE